MYFREGFPSIAYYIQDGNNLGSRIAFKCRVLQDDGPQFFSQTVGGLVDVGANARIITHRKLEFKQNAKVLWNDVLYSVQSITPFIPDPSMQGFTKRKLQAEYLIQLV
jgi:hypothetical protein